MRAPLEVVTGIRGATEIMPAAPASPPQPQRLGPLPEGFVEYHSAHGSLMLHLADSHKMRDPDSGAEFIRPGIDLRFEMNVARTDDDEIRHRCEGCPPTCELHKRRFGPHRGYGIGQLFWRADAAREQASRLAVEREVSKLKADPAYAQSILAALQEIGGEGMVPPAREAEKPASVEAADDAAVLDEFVDETPRPRKRR